MDALRHWTLLGGVLIIEDTVANQQLANRFRLDFQNLPSKKQALDETTNRVVYDAKKPAYPNVQPAVGARESNAISGRQ